MRSDHLAKHIKTHENKVKRNSGSKTLTKGESNKKNVKEEEHQVITATDIIIKKEKEDLSSGTANNNNNDRSICDINHEKKNQDQFLSPNYPNYTSPYTASAYTNFQTNSCLSSGPTNHSNNNNNTFSPPTPPLLSESDAKNMFHTYNTSHPSHLHHHHHTATTMPPSPFSNSINNSNNNYNQPLSRVPLSPSAYTSSSSNSTVPLSSSTNSHILSPTSSTPQNYHHFNDTNLPYSSHHHPLVNQVKTPALNYHQTLNNNSYYMTNITINQIGPLATSPSTTRPLNSTNTFGGALHLTR